MKTIKKSATFIIAAFLCLFLHDPGYGLIQTGQIAPAFSLKDIKNRTYDISQATTQTMTILYFFDVESKPSQEGLLTMNNIAKKYAESDLSVWAITASHREKVAGFAGSADYVFPVLIDDADVSDLYQARVILPTVCIVGPGLKVLDFFQGGGKTMETMLVRVAERKLQQKQTMIAKAISSEVIKKNPENTKAQTVSGYAALKEGNFDEAEDFFQALSRKGSKAEILGKEGLANVYVKKEQPQKALQLVEEVEQKAPERSFVHVIKGDLLYSQGKHKEAEREFQKAVKKQEAEPYQMEKGYNQLGRMYADAGRYEEARDLYDQVVKINPWNIEGTTNKGLTYEKEGRMDKALESYQQALSIDSADTFAAVLARKAREMIDLQGDVERKKRMDSLIKDLSERYRTFQETRPEIEDAWTSRPMVITFVDFQEKGGLSERDGLSAVLVTQLGDLLNSSGRVKVVDRILIERLLEELNLGSSDLADPETALRLGKVLAAKLIGTGTLYITQQGSMLSFRLIDTETSAIPQVLTKQLSSQALLEKEFFSLNREILKNIISTYPLRGYLAKKSGDRFIINIGSTHGVVNGTRFDVLEEGEAIEYKGKTLKGAPKSIGQVEVVQVEPGMSHVKPLNQQRELRVDDRIQEILMKTDI